MTDFDVLKDIFEISEILEEEDECCLVVQPSCEANTEKVSFLFSKEGDKEMNNKFSSI